MVCLFILFVSQGIAVEDDEINWVLKQADVFGDVPAPLRGKLFLLRPDGRSEVMKSLARHDGAI